MKHSSLDNWCFIPEQLVFDILLRLPVTSLLRFKSVCKSWYTLIDSPNFISHHSDRNSGHDNLLGMHLDAASVGYLKSCLLSGKKYEVYNNIDCGLRMHLFNSETELAFSSKGIICFIHYDAYISLWNPAIRQLRSLRVPDQKYSFFGFGFNVKSNDHNIVRTSLCNENTSKTIVEVYSLRADSWRTMHTDFAMPFRFYNSLTYQISKDGICYWIAYSRINSGTDDNVILSFDLNEETYEAMPLPVGKVRLPAVIDFLGDKLVYIHCVNCRRGYYEIWVLHEYGVKESWNKTWKIGPIDKPGTDVFFPSRFISNGEFLLFTDDQLHKHCGTFCLYNLVASAYNFTVNWAQNPKESLNAWASRMRFQVNDNLVFKYEQTDYILVVKKEDFDSCNVSSPIQKLEGGNSKFELTRPGPYHFISGVAEKCKNGEKMILVVMTPRRKKRPVASPPTKSFSSVVSPAPSPMKSGDQISPSPAPASSVPEPKSSGSVLRVGTSAMVMMMVLGNAILG